MSVAMTVVLEIYGLYYKGAHSPCSFKYCMSLSDEAKSLKQSISLIAAKEFT